MMMVAFASGFVFCSGCRDQQSGGGGTKGSKIILRGPAQAPATQQVHQRNMRGYLFHVCQIFEDARPGLSCVRQEDETRSRGSLSAAQRVPEVSPACVRA